MARTLQPIKVGEIVARRYRIEEHVGSGGMGDVYRVYDNVLNEQVALKMLSPSLLVEPEAIDQFKEEVKLGRRVVHRNVARLFDFGVDDDNRAYLTMELIQGETLRKRMRRPPPLTLQDAVDVGAALAAGLAAAHDLGIVHRDLKPGNVMLAGDDGAAGAVGGARVRIIDFGGARSLSSTTTVNVGTLKYMAPEQLRGEPATTAADVYALGLVLWELIAATPPFPWDPRERLRSRAPRLRSRLAVPAAVDDVVDRCLASDEGARPTAPQVASALASVHADLTRVVAPGSAPAVLDETEREPWREATEEAPLPWAPRAVDDAAAHVVAVRPFAAQGAQAAPLAAAVTHALRDILALTDGLRVQPPDHEGLRAHGHAVELRGLDERDAGLALDVDVLIDGTVGVDDAGGARKARVHARLLDVETGKSHGAVDAAGRAESVLELAHTAARKIAEALRVKLATEAWRGVVPAEALDTWLRTRARARQGVPTDLTVDWDDLERALQQAPELLPAWAARALVAARLSLIPIDPRHDWGARAGAAVADARRLAPDLPDTHLAAGFLAQTEGRFADAVGAARAALQLAPAFAEAHELLGRLELESGRVADGVRRLRLAADLDQRCVTSLALVERAALFRGRRDIADRAAARIRERAVVALEHMLLRLRLALWTGDVDAARIERIVDAPPFEPGRSLFPIMRDVAGGGDIAPLVSLLHRTEERSPTTRILVLLEQLCAEAFAARGGAGAGDAALGHIESAMRRGLFDLEWLDHCPALSTLRALPRFARVRTELVERVALPSPV